MKCEICEMRLTRGVLDKVLEFLEALHKECPELNYVVTGETCDEVYLEVWDRNTECDQEPR